jgi:hypothetical protein
MARTKPAARNRKPRQRVSARAKTARAPTARARAGAPPRRAAARRNQASPFASVTSILGDATLAPKQAEELAGTVLQQAAEGDLAIQKKCFLTLYSFQTAAEVACGGVSLERNKRGFDSFDAARCSSLGAKLLADPFRALTASDVSLLSRTTAKHRAQIVSFSSRAQLKDIFTQPLAAFCKVAEGLPPPEDAAHDMDYVVGDDDEDDGEYSSSEGEEEEEASDVADAGDEELDDEEYDSDAPKAPARVHTTHKQTASAAPRSASAPAAALLERVGGGPASAGMDPPPAGGAAPAGAGGVGQAACKGSLASEYTITAGVFTRAAEDIWAHALASGAATAEDVFRHFAGAGGIALHDVHTRMYTSRRFNTAPYESGAVVVSFQNNTWTRCVVEKVTQFSIFVKVLGVNGAGSGSGSAPTEFWVSRATELLYIERAAPPKTAG